MTDQTGRRRWIAPRIAAAVAALLVGVFACGDPYAFNWSDQPDTVQLYSLARPELNLVSAFNFFDRATVRVEAPNSSGTWDMALDTRDQTLVLVPPGALGITSTASITTLYAIAFDDVVEAPGDTTAYHGEDPVPLSAGAVYVVRTGRRTGAYGSSCVYYAKLEPIDIDVPDGTLKFRFVVNPICNSRDLIPRNR